MAFPTLKFGRHIKMKKLLVLILIGLIFFSCSNSDNEESPKDCDFETLINSQQYANTNSDQFTINSLAINDDCFTINFSSSGCDGNSWELKLIDSGAVAESLPPQRDLKLSFKNEEGCLAYLTKEITFDISNLQVDGQQVLLNIININESILYQYE